MAAGAAASDEGLVLVRAAVGGDSSRAARERGGPLSLIDVADALLDERRELTERVRN